MLAVGLVAALSVGVMAQAPAPAQAPPAVDLKVGDMAPDFTLPGTDGKTHKLSDYRGKQAVVIAWFPKAFTQGCTIECKSLAANGDKLKMYEMAYFMASVDPLEENIKFAKATSVTLQSRGGGPATVVEKAEADFPMLSDESKSVATAYGVLNRGGLSNRWTFYIDKSGRIAAIDKAVQPATSAEDMIAKLNELKIPMNH
jgi:peroxiredoxin Q/BCP